MNRVTVFFLSVAAPLLALVLAWLGWLTRRANLLGWFLLVLGLGFALGVIVRYWILHNPYWFPRSGGDFKAEEKGDRSFWLIVPGLGLPLFLAPLEYLLLPALLPRSPTVQFTGAGLLVLSWLLFGEARRMIRTSYSGHLGVTSAQKLVQAGPYRLVRHPAYLSFILMALGFSLGYSSIAGLVCVPLLLIPGLVYRIRVEDALLKGHFKDEWAAYAQRTKRLIPGLW